MFRMTLILLLFFTLTIPSFAFADNNREVRFKDFQINQPIPEDIQTRLKNQ